MPYGASTKLSFDPIDDDLWLPAAGSCSDQGTNSAAISSDGSHIIAVLQSAGTQPSVFDFNANRRLEPSDCVDIDECSLGTHTCFSNQTGFNPANLQVRTKVDDCLTIIFFTCFTITAIVISPLTIICRALSAFMMRATSLPASAHAPGPLARGSLAPSLARPPSAATAG
jgi:hypothetical protein